MAPQPSDLLRITETLVGLHPCQGLVDGVRDRRRAKRSQEARLRADHHVTHRDERALARTLLVTLAALAKAHCV